MCYTHLSTIMLDKCVQLTKQGILYIHDIEDYRETKRHAVVHYRETKRHAIVHYHED